MPVFKTLLYHLTFSILCMLSLASFGQGTWQSISSTDSYYNRDECGYVAVNGKFYLVGGAYMGNPIVQEYDPLSNSWTNKGTPPAGFHHMQVVTDDSLIWVMGAWQGNFNSEVGISHVYSYDPVNDSWSQRMAVPANRRRGSSGVVHHQGKFYVFGGNVGGHGSQGDVKDWVDVYDPSGNAGAGSWDTLAPMPVGRDHFHATLVGDSVYLIGGRNSGVSTNIFADVRTQIDIYNILTDTWVTLDSTKDLPSARSGSAVAVMDDEIIVMLGVGTSRTDERTEVEAFNVKSQSWRSLAQPSDARSGTQAIVYGRDIYIASGDGGNLGGTALYSQDKFTLPNPNSPPTLTGPYSQNTSVGDSIGFDVAVYPFTNINYQWQKLVGANWIDIVGETSDHLTFNPVTLALDSTWYRVVVSNAFGITTSGAVLLRVNCDVIQGNTDPIVFEAEDFHAEVAQNNQNWQINNQNGSVVSTISALPNVGTNTNNNIASQSPETLYNIDFVTTGTYYVWLRMYAPTFEDNSLHAGLNSVVQNSADKITYNSYNQWGWTNATMDGPLATINVTQAGIHTFHLWMREDGAVVDRILLTTDALYSPSGTGPGANDNCLSTAPFPVEFISFEGEPQPDGIQLRWITAQERNNDFFEIQKSDDALLWRSLNKVGGYGNSSIEQQYSWLDQAPNNGVNYYRLKQVDVDGGFAYSSVIRINWDGGESWSLLAWPNPVTDGELTISLQVREEEADLCLKDINGQVVRQSSLSRRDGISQSLSFDVTELPAGFYLLQLESKNHREVKKVVIK